MDINYFLENEIRRWLKYQPNTGNFVWLKRPNSKIGKHEVAGNIRPNGYIHITVRGHRFYAHRLAWFYMTGEMPNNPIDHINGDSSDNRFENLRIATPRINSLNRRTPKSNISGHIGINKINKTGKWQATIKVFGKTLFLGNYINFDDAVAARKLAEQENGFHENHGR